VGQDSSGRERRRHQWEALRVLRKISTLPRIKKCRHLPSGEGVTVARRGDRAHYSGLQTCGSVWACPVCSAKIQAERGEELLHAVENAHARGLKIALLTLTMRHRAHHRLTDLWDALSPAWQAALTTDRAVRRARTTVGLVGWVRRVEATYGQNGWHLHVHALLFYEDGSNLGDLREAIWAGWLRRLTDRGFDAVEERGISLFELDLAGAHEEIGSYLNKATYYGRTSKSAAHELGGQIGKRGRRGNRAPFDVLADVIADGLAEDAGIWAEWERTSRGRRALTWSQGLRDALLTDAERSDEEIAAETDGDQVDVVFLERAAWTEIVDRQLEVSLLEAIEHAALANSYDAAAAFLDQYGLGPPLRPPSKE
jgi:hypothetical protein